MVGTLKCKECCKKYMDSYAPEYRNKKEIKAKTKKYDKKRYKDN